MRNDFYLYTGAPLPQVPDDMFPGFRKSCTTISNWFCPELNVGDDTMLAFLWLGLNLTELKKNFQKYKNQVLSYDAHRELSFEVLK